MSPRYFVAKRGRRGSGPRHYWSPSRALRKDGWGTLRLSDDKTTAAIEADQRNAQLDRWRATDKPEDAPTPSRNGITTAGVYVFGATDRLIKIGVSTNPMRRLSAIRSASGRNLNLIYFRAWPSLNALEVEAATHWVLRRSREHGEWFDIDSDRAIRAIEHAAATLHENETGSKTARNFDENLDKG